MMYMLHVASYLGIIVTAAGFITMHFAVKQKSLHLRIASWVLIVGGILGLLCMLYYSMTYWQQGAFSEPMLTHNMNIMPMHNAPMPIQPTK